MPNGSPHEHKHPPVCTVYFLLLLHPWTWKDGLYKVRDYLTLTAWANHCSCRMKKSYLLLRNSSVLGTDALGEPWKHVQISGSKQFQNVFLQIFIQKVLYKGILWVPLGIIWELRSLRPLYMRWIFIWSSPSRPALGSHFILLITAGFGFLFICRIKELLALGFWKKKNWRTLCSVRMYSGPFPT